MIFSYVSVNSNTPFDLSPNFNSYLFGWIKFCLNWLYIIKFVFEYTRLFIWKYTFQLIFKHFIIIWWRRSCWSSRYWSTFSWWRISTKILINNYHYWKMECLINLIWNHIEMNASWILPFSWRRHGSISFWWFST